jgi:hypothetical protein
MSTVNPQLEEIIARMTDAAANEAEALALIATKQDESFARLDFLAGQMETNVTYTGAIAADMEALDLKLGDHTGLLTQIRDILTDISNANEVLLDNLAANFAQLFISLDLMIANNAANAVAIRNAVCGDCGPPPVPPIEDGASCRISTGGSSGPTAEVALSVTYFIGPGVTATTGDTVRYRVNTCTRVPVAVTLYEGPGSTGTFHALEVGGDYVEYVMPASTSTIVFTFGSPGAFNFNQTACLVGTPI